MVSSDDDESDASTSLSPYASLMVKRRRSVSPVILETPTPTDDKENQYDGNIKNLFIENFKK